MPVVALYPQRLEEARLEIVDDIFVRRPLEDGGQHIGRAELGSEMSSGFIFDRQCEEGFDPGRIAYCVVQIASAHDQQVADTYRP